MVESFGSAKVSSEHARRKVPLKSPSSSLQEILDADSHATFHPSQASSGI